MPIVIIPVGWMVECLGGDPNSPSRSIFPGIYILKFWQGIVDIVLRAITLVLAFLVFVLAVILNYGINGWVAFTASFVILEEVIAVIVRFINPGLIWQRPVIPLIFSIIYYIVALVMLFPGFVVAAVFSTVHTGIGAVAAFTVFLMVLVGALLAWAILWYTLKWYAILEEVTDTQAPAASTDPEGDVNTGAENTTDKEAGAPTILY